ncbi:alpha/beta hydrolase [Chryseobacterium sp.]|uniref:alpha/beta hydrolase n=1 Tax=Chryseobacterium sp. TaxID=1871047 RepID=UPI002FC62AC3
MKIYIVSGLGADYKVLERLVFPKQHEVIFIDWLVPKPNEKFNDYVIRMAEKIDDAEPFYLLGYSFGGIMVQEINRVKPALKTVILGSIKSDKEKSKLIKIGQFTKIPRYLPVRMFNIKTLETYAVFRKFFDPKNPKVTQYFRFTDPYYLKWSLQRISEWKFDHESNVIQILGDRDIVFPVRNSKPDYIIKGGTHLFPVTKHKEVSQLLNIIFI